jgi:gliding motility-associated-like protein
VDTTNESGAGNNGAIDLTVTGGQPPYAFQWDDSTVTTEDRSGLSLGNYTVTITDQFGCEITQTILIRGNALFVDITGSSFNGAGVSCTGECDGEVLALPGNGIGNLTYKWSNGPTSQVISNVCPGTYTVTVTDELGQTAIASYEIVEPEKLILQLQIACASEPGTADGSALAQVSGGKSPYDFEWSDGSSNAQLQNASPGQYVLVVSDNNGCQIVQQFDICISGIECYQAITVITPNEDGKNDRFTINCIYDLPNTLSIYNRYGGKEFEMTNYDNTWEGTDQDGNILSDGGYHWVLQVFLSTGERRIYKGTVSLLRSLD